MPVVFVQRAIPTLVPSLFYTRAPERLSLRACRAYRGPAS